MCSAYRGGRQTVGGVVTRLARSVAWWPGRKHKVRQAVRKNFIINRGTISFCRILYGYILKIANRFYPNGRKGPVRSLHHCLKAKMTRNLGKPWIYREIKLPSQKAFEALQFVCELFFIWIFTNENKKCMQMQSNQRLWLFQFTKTFLQLATQLCSCTCCMGKPGLGVHPHTHDGRLQRNFFWHQTKLCPSQRQPFPMESTHLPISPPLTLHRVP